MSLKEVEDAVRNWQLEDELAQSPGFCRRSAIEMAKVAREADKTKPHARIGFLAWPKANKGESVHYAVKASASKKTILFNPVSTAGFPKYNGPKDTAPGKFQEMKRAKNVI